MTIENIEKLLKLKSENPELEVIHQIKTDVISGDFDWEIGYLLKIEVEVYYSCEEYFYYGEDDIRDKLADDLYDNGEIDDEDIEKEVEKLYQKYEKEGKIKKAIWIIIDR